MSMTLTAWRLKDPAGTKAHCTISERDRRWRLIVHRGDQVFLSERYTTDDEALSRSTDLWRVMTAQGWREPMH